MLRQDGSVHAWNDVSELKRSTESTATGVLPGGSAARPRSGLGTYPINPLPLVPQISVSTATTSSPCYVSWSQSPRPETTSFASCRYCPQLTGRHLQEIAKLSPVS